MALRAAFYRLAKSLRRLRQGEEGQTLVEYALILALIAIVVIAIVSALGHTASSVFSNVNSSIANP
ncbi:MAG: Flp family type IVb pilin [Thermaerobacter sp.]|nr:Flp family type IVb pilin [Thermaerobacter sp.]